MAKNRTSSAASRNGGSLSVVRDSSTGRFVDKKQGVRSFRGTRRGPEILFPTEPSTIGREKIDRAIERVLSRKKY